ncbi:uncharacterized protein B0I36DRAFT_65816 [Microdochium trichocladiopsis]|uniref:Tip elongation aberrant protein 1 n=1 Tax=Microdochium trichocladiopsis TaxID=1682393 RepID=A0A9P8YEA2_9PEZI|nr:uncharacterized protein B0I36DRAFT_65816 [Microdochium trichocladiopsis]KAH7037416.1 hypothetical protein B0I36DRAFT_65816 [Microdochium trichocladiopsis]
MAFLFKSKKNADRNTQSRDGGGGSGSRGEKMSRSTPTGSLNSFDEGSPGTDPEKFAARRAAAAAADQQSQPLAKQPQQQPVSDLPFRNGPTANPAPTTTTAAPSANASLYPWSQRRLTFTSSIPSPFPRYGAAVNSVASKEGDIYIMGGLVNSSTVKGDLWMIEAGGSMSCFPLATTAEGPGPRVGHASLLVGNAFIVYGGDTKIEETDILDETLYLLNTSTRQWSRALPAGPRPSGRYGHSLNIVGSKIYIFGGQVEGYFMNDLCAFDLNQLQMPNNRWEVLIENTEVSNPAHLAAPPARTNHSMVTYDDKLYLFGGTNGFQWFNDVWCYDPAINKWAQLDCIGYIPVPREGHAAALVDDVMYVFGGRTEDGTDLGDLAAFRITSRRWYTFQNMGPSPSPRSGHSMTAVAKTIVVVGGEPSSATSQVNDLSITYLLDTTKIRYPNDAQIQSSTQKLQQGRRPSGEQAVRGPSRDGSNGPDPKRIAGGPGSPTSAMTRPNGVDSHAPPPVSNGIAKLPRNAGTSTPSGPPPQGQPPRPMVNTDPAARPRNASIDRIERERSGTGSPAGSSHHSPITRTESPMGTGRGTPVQQQTRAAPVAKAESAVIEDTVKSKPTRTTRGHGSVDSSTEPSLKNVVARPASPPPPTRQTSNPLSRKGSNRNSQTVALLKELDSSRNRIAWYASELELARKSGYVPNATLSPVLDSRSTETFDDEDKPLIEALLAMRQELANVQASVDKQAVLAAKKIADAEKQRDAAIREAAYAKAKMASQAGGVVGEQARSVPDTNDHRERSNELNRKLAASINLQRDLQAELERRVAELDAERRARQLADDTSMATQRRLADLEQYKQQTSLQVESLKAELHAAQREAREHSIASADATAALQLLRVEKDDYQSRYNEAAGGSKDTNETLESLREAVATSADLRSHLERKLDEERAQREKVESKLTKIKAEHETRTAELVAVSQRLRDAEEIAERHAAEAKSHRQVVAAGLDKLTREGSKASKADAERLSVLQGQVATANSLVKRLQQEADDAGEKLRRAEERIAGLEAYQEQSSREGVTIRRQLQSALRDTQSLQAMNSDLKHQLSSQQLEANAISVQHNTLKDILAERGVSPTNTARSRGGPSSTDSPDPARTGELERQLAQAVAAHEETKQLFAGQAQEMEGAYRERVAQLENDYQSAVHYVKGTEKMLKRMKEELAKYKSDNARLKNENIELEDRVAAAASSGGAAPSDWEEERAALMERIDTLEGQVRSTSEHFERQLAAIKAELATTKTERDTAKKTSAEAATKLASKEQALQQMQEEVSLLERRAQDAEQKVSLLLDQVENSVDNYRRRSRISGDQDRSALPTSTNGMSHTRQESSDAGSMYGGVGDARNSAALDSLANELDMLRSHWETTNKNYRLSNTFDFEGPSPKKEDDGNGAGLSESLADWRKRLDTEERENKTRGPQ